VTVVHRRRLQRQRKDDDSALAALRAPGGQRLRALLRGMLELVYGAEVGAHVAQRTDDSGDEQDMPSTGVSVLRVVARHPVAFMVAGFALIMAISLRSVLITPGNVWDWIGTSSSTGQDLFREFASTDGESAFESSTLPPSLVVLGGLVTLTFNKVLLAQKLLMWLALPLAAATCIRALRVVVPQLWARTLAGLLYASSPLAVGALAQRRLGELAFLILAPPALAQVVLAFRAEQPREPWRPAPRFFLLATGATIFYPPALLVFGTIVASATIVVLVRIKGAGRITALRQAMFLGASFLGTLLFLLPWHNQLFAALGWTGGLLTSRLADPSLIELLQLNPGGPEVLGRLVGPVYPALALAALLYVPAGRRRQIFGLLVGLLAATVAATWQAHVPTSGIASTWPAGLLVPGAVAWAAVCGLAMQGIATALLRKGLSLRRGMAALVTVMVCMTGGLLVGALAQDAAVPSHPAERLSLPTAVFDRSSKILWLSSQPGQDVEFLVTDSNGHTQIDSTRREQNAVTRVLQEIVNNIMQSRTNQAGSLLDLLGIRHVVLQPGSRTDQLRRLLSRQLDLRIKVAPPRRPVPSISALSLVMPGYTPPTPSLDPRHLHQARWNSEVPNTPAVITPEYRIDLWIKAQTTTHPMVFQTLPARRDGVIVSGSALPSQLKDWANASGVFQNETVTGPATILLPYQGATAWRASVGGRSLDASPTLSGWIQAFHVPAGVSGTLQIQRPRDPGERIKLTVAGMLLLAAVLVTARPTRVAPPPPPGSSGPPGAAGPSAPSASPTPSTSPALLRPKTTPPLRGNRL
jgi:hypothetical protein